MKFVASVSFGKDSLAMLLLILEHKLQLDEVIFYNTGMEFEAIYHIRDKVIPILEEYGIKYTELSPRMPFEEKMYNFPHYSRKGDLKQGYGWCGGRCRWGTTEKQSTIDSYLKKYDAVHQYVGIALDEPERLERLSDSKSSPLAQMGYTEAMALDYCHSKGFYWNEEEIELYDILDRVSCWCCRNKNLKELKNIKHCLPKYWNRLIELEEKIGEPMKKPLYLSERFGKTYRQLKLF